MSFALTENSKLVCAHQGAVRLTAGQSKLTVSGAKVLVDGDLASAPVQGCITVVTPPPPGPVSKPCLTIASAIGGVASKLKVQGKGVLLDSIAIGSDGMVAGAPLPPATIPGTVQTAGETKLKAI
jgi:hypothetical protein